MFTCGMYTKVWVNYMVPKAPITGFTTTSEGLLEAKRTGFISRLFFFMHMVFFKYHIPSMVHIYLWNGFYKLKQWEKQLLITSIKGE